MAIDALCNAVQKHDVVIVKFLLDQGANVNASDGLGWTPLHHVVLKPHADIIKLLFEYRANVNAFNAAGKTPLHFAVLKSHVDTVKLLLDHGANVNEIDNRGKTPLRYAVRNHHPDIVKLLLEHGAYIHAFDDFEETPLCHHIAKIYVHNIKLLWKPDTDVNVLDKAREKSLHFIVRISHADIINLILDHGVHNKGQAALHNLVLEPPVYIIKLLLEYGSNVNCLDVYGRTPLHCFVLGPHVDIVKILLEYGANLNALDYSHQTPLHYAVLKPHVNMVKLLLEHGALVNASDEACLTPLHHAILNPHVDIVKLLLEHGADIDAVDSSFRTPLHYAALRHDVDIVKFLLDHGANANALNVLYQTPLHYFLTADKPDISVIYKLMKHGANVNAVDQYGMHVLSAAVCNLATPYEVVKLFLENGAIPIFENETNILVDISLSESYCLAKLLIQYIILRISLSCEMFELLDQFKSVLLVHFAEESQNYKLFLRIVGLCINEIKNMRNDFIREQTLFQFVSKNCLRTATYDQNVTMYDIDELLFLLRNGKYVECRDLIYGAIKRSIVVDRLCELKICYQAAGSDTLTLNYDCIYNLTNYMLKDDVINLCIVFCDEFSNCKCPPTSTSKRSAEEDNKNVFKKP